MQPPAVASPTQVFITGGTGFIGAALIAELVARGHDVTALVRAGSERKLPAGVRAIGGDPLAHGAWEREVPHACTFVHLVGISKPSPWKRDQFERVDLASVRVAIDAARAARATHFIYLSVAQPAPIMRSYLRVRAQGELAIRAAGLDATFVRPWYVLGPGRRWPLALVPIFKVLEMLPQTRASALRLGFVTIEQMTRALAWAVEHPARGARVLDVPAIRAGHV